MGKKAVSGKNTKTTEASSYSTNVEQYITIKDQLERKIENLTNMKNQRVQDISDDLPLHEFQKEFSQIDDEFDAKVKHLRDRIAKLNPGETPGSKSSASSRVS